MPRNDLNPVDFGRPNAKARSLGMASAARGLIITYGIVVFTLLRRRISDGAPSELNSFGPGPMTLLLIGLFLQVARWLVLKLVARYEKDQGLEGAFSPAALHTVDLLVDGVTVLLFAVATFQGVIGAANI